jgi:hypothetical protein
MQRSNQIQLVCTSTNTYYAIKYEELAQQL